ncbi:MAG: GNAT family N-acetyltransferase [Cryomorphaceae bacterium]
MKNTRLVPSSDRLHFFELSPSDANRLYLLNSDQEVIRYTGDAPFRSIEDARQFLIQYDEYERSGFGRWGLARKDNDAFIGWCGLKRHENGEVDVGFRLLQSEWKQGFATEASLACLQLAFETLHLPYVIGRVMRENTASIQVLERIGMRFWKETEEDLHCALCFKIDNPSLH